MALCAAAARETVAVLLSLCCLHTIPIPANPYVGSDKQRNHTINLKCRKGCIFIKKFPEPESFYLRLSIVG